MKRAIYLLIFLTITIPIFAQTREDILVHVAPVTAARPDHSAFFKQNFDQETAAAGYALTENISESDYVLRLEVRPNLIMYDDGFEEPAPPDEPQFLLTVTLFQNEDNVEIVAFSFPFTELEEMYEFNLFLLYQAMATVPLTRFGDVVEQDDLWRNKWLYIRGSLDFPITVHQPPTGFYVHRPGDRNNIIPIYNDITYLGGATIGLEFQYLHWMSSELQLIARFGSPSADAFIPGMGLQVKFPIKPPVKIFKISPFLMGQIQLITIPDIDIPNYSVGGGVQFGVRGGNSGSIFIDVSYLHTIGEVKRRNTFREHTVPDQIPYSRWVISFGIGYKYGLYDRPLHEPRRRSTE